MTALARFLSGFRAALRVMVMRFWIWCQSTGRACSSCAARAISPPGWVGPTARTQRADRERDPNDARWIYHSVDQEALAKLSSTIRHLLDVKRGGGVEDDRERVAGVPAEEVVPAE